MLFIKTSFLLALLISCLYSTFCWAEQSLFFNENEQASLIFTQDEWLLELNQYKNTLNSKRDAQPYSTPGVDRSDTDGILGPIVSIIDPKPENDIYRSSAPVRLLIYLKSRVAPINIETLQVKGKRGFFSLNITDRLKPFMRPPHNDENADYVIDANIPKLGEGHYMIVLSLADIQGNQEEHKAFLEVIQ